MNISTVKTTFCMLAKLAQSDGSVSSSEIKVLEKLVSVLKLKAEDKKIAIEAFNLAKKSEKTFSEYATEYKVEMESKPEMLKWMLDLLVKVAYADRELSDSEHDMLEQACNIFEVSTDNYKKISNSSLFSRLGCSRKDSKELIKEKYDKLLEVCCPDKMSEMGLPKEFIDLAKNVRQEVVSAYQSISKEATSEKTTSKEVAFEGTDSTDT